VVPGRGSCVVRLARLRLGGSRAEEHLGRGRSGDPRRPGQLYNPDYFNKGIAVHGYDSVPATAASHGCVRTPMHIAEYLHDLVNQGDPVHVFGGKPAKVISPTPL
jgi:lipoprotein-anchoring transpeptidase ErfK/SrfK